MASSIDLEGYRPELVRLARYLLQGNDQQVDEIVDDAMMAYLAHGHKGIGSVRTKLMRCLRNRVSNELQRLATWRNTFSSLDGIPEDAVLPGPLPKMNMQLDVNDAVSALSPPYNTLVRLYYLDGATLYEVAAVHKLPVTTAYRKINEGLCLLKEALAAYKY